LSELGTGSWATSLAQSSIWTSTIAGRIDVAISTRLAPTVSGRTLNVNVSGEGDAVLNTATQTQITDILEDTGTTLPGLISGISGGGSSLTGPYTRTVTVTDSDSSAAIQIAKVRLYRTGETGTSTTNASGVASFTVEAATWSYAITANGYIGATGTIVVSANGDTAVELDAATVTPPTDPALSAIEVVCLGADFSAESDIDIDFRLAEIPSGDQNKTYPGAKVTVSSDVDGIARWEAPQGAVVEYKRGNTHSWQRVTLDADDATNVTSVIGSP